MKAGHIEDGQKRIRVYLGGEAVADSTRVKLVWEKPYYPVYYFPADDVRGDLLAPSGDTARSPGRGIAELLDVKTGDRVATDAAYRYPEPEIEGLEDLVAFRWDAVDAWFEEDEQVYVHARDPYTRIDILSSSRHVEVMIDGVTVAESHKPTILFETGLVPRFYLPQVHVRLDLLTPTDSVTHCPYKGDATYWSIRAGDETHEDIAWSYRTPHPESARIAGLISFYNERVDLRIDGELQERPSRRS